MALLARVLAVACVLGSGAATGHEGIGKELADLDDAIRARPTAAPLYVRRAALERLRRNRALAFDDLSVAAELAPDDLELAYQRGLLLFEAGHLADGVRDLDRVLDRHPTRVRARDARARAHEQLGHSALARRDFEEALLAQPTLDRFLALGAFEERAGEPALAAAWDERGVAMLGDASVLLLEAARVDVRLGRLELALAHLDRVAKGGGFLADLRLRRADILERMGRASEARIEREAALAEVEEELVRRPSALRRLTRKRALAALGQVDEAHM